jgi:hypothetical protein
MEHSRDRTAPDLAIERDLVAIGFRSEIAVPRVLIEADQGLRERIMLCLLRKGSHMLKRFVSNLLLPALVVAVVSFPGSFSVGAMAQEDAIRPSLADLMALTQLRQFKLWYAERVRNWKLSAYELDQFQATRPN